MLMTALPVALVATGGTTCPPVSVTGGVNVQRSEVVHALASSQEEPVARAFTHPPAPSHVSFVQALWSSQSDGTHAAPSRLRAPHGMAAPSVARGRSVDPAPWA